MRTPNLEPVKVPGRNRPWRLNIPPSLSNDGKRQQLFFKTKDAAEKHAEGLEKGRKTYGDLILALDHHQISQAVRAWELLRPTGIGLLEAVNGFLADHARRSASKTLRDTWAAFLASKRRSDDYLDSLRHTKSLVEHLMARAIVDIQAEDLEAALNGLRDSTKDLRINRLRTVFNYAIRKGWLTTNPASRLDLAGSRASEIAIYSAENIEKILTAVRTNDLEFAPFVVVCTFAGLRPENEAFSIKWSDIHLDAEQPHLIVRADTSKTRERRSVDLSDNAVAWLRTVWPKEHSGRVFPFSESTLARKRADLVEKTGIRWLKDGLRHTFASAHMAKHSDATKLMLAMGHKDLKMIWKNYYRHMTAEEADKFWAISPSAKS